MSKTREARAGRARAATPDEHAETGAVVVVTLEDRGQRLTHQTHDSGTVHEFSVDTIDPSPYQKRTSFPEGELLDLADSISQNGLLQPITVRLIRDRCELIAGERRWRAFKLLGRELIPALVIDATDEQAARLATIENLQRAQLPPLEEADQLAQLASIPLPNGQAATPDSIAAELGLRPRYVRERLKLANLGEDGRTALQERRITPEHAMLMAQLDAKAQEQLATYGLFEGFGSTDKKMRGKPLAASRVRPVGEWREWVTMKTPKLDGAPFALDDATLGGVGACVGCPHRSATADDLFAQLGGADVCTLPKCYSEKTHAAILRTIAELDAQSSDKHGALLLSADHNAPDKKTWPGRTVLTSSQYRDATKKKCDATRAGVLVHRYYEHQRGGLALGSLLQVCADKTCPTHWESYERAAGKPAKKTPAAREKARAERLSEDAKREATVRLAKQIAVKLSPAGPAAARLYAQATSWISHMAWRAWDELASDFKIAVVRWYGLEPGKTQYGRDPDSPMQAHMKTQPVGELFRFGILCTLAEQVKAGYTRGHDTRGLEALTKRLKIDRPKLEKAVYDEMEETRAAAQPRRALIEAGLKDKKAKQARRVGGKTKGGRK